MGHLNGLDIAVVAAYFAFTIGIVWWAARSNTRKGDDSAGYFLAGRDLNWVVVGASLFVANVGSEHLVGLTGTGAASGFVVGQFEWLATLALLALAWVFVPFYLRTGVFTMPEFLERRFNPGCRLYFSLITLVSYVLTQISVALYAGGVILQDVLGVSIWASAGIVVLITGVYTVVGGLRAVAYADLFQAVVLIVGSGALAWMGVHHVGGWAELQRRAPQGFFSVWKAAHDPEFPWTGIVFGAPILALWYWCTNQFIVQRVLAARNQGEAQTGSVLAGFLKILPMFIFVLPGIVANVVLGDITPQNADHALPRLILKLLHPGLVGLYFAALLAALMGSLSAVFNSCSTLVTWDLYKKLRPKASDRSLVAVGRFTTVGLVIVGLAWIPLMKNISSNLYVYLQSVQGYIAPPVAACFLVGLLWPRVNGAGALSALLSGFAVGGARLVLEILAKAHRLRVEGWVKWFVDVNFLHFAALLFVFSTLVLAAVSLATPAPSGAQLAGLTWWTRDQKPRHREGEQVPLPPAVESRAQLRLNWALSGLLVAVMAALWVVFR